MQQVLRDRRAVVLMVSCFIVIMVTPAVVERTHALHPGVAARVRQDYGMYGLEVTLQQVEKHLVYDSAFATAVRQPYQVFLVEHLAQASRAVLPGRHGFLFSQGDIASTTGIGILSNEFLKEEPHGIDVLEKATKFVRAQITGRSVRQDQATSIVRPANSLAVLTDLHEWLSRRGVHLTIVVIPGKSTIYPEELWERYPQSSGPAWNVDYLQWREQLTESGVDVVDLSDEFWSGKRSADEPLFLRQDSHWSPRGVALAADVVANHVRRFVGQGELLGLTTTKQAIPEPNDLVVLLGLRSADRVFPRSPVEITRVHLPTTELGNANDAAPLLLFGDSLSGYYEEANDVNEGRSAGFASQLRLRLGVGVSQFIGFGDDEPLVIKGALLRAADTLRNKKVVVLEFSMPALYLKRFNSLLTSP